VAKRTATGQAFVDIEKQRAAIEMLQRLENRDTEEAKAFIARYRAQVQQSAMAVFDKNSAGTASTAAAAGSPPSLRTVETRSAGANKSSSTRPATKANSKSRRMSAAHNDRNVRLARVQSAMAINLKRGNATVDVQVAVIDLPPSRHKNTTTTAGAASDDDDEEGQSNE